MKKVPCSNPACNKRRVHHERPDENRETVLCDVPDDYMGKTFCSVTCACEAGYFHVQHGWIKDPETDEPVQPKREESADTSKPAAEASNVFADLGFDNAAEIQAKADVMSDIQKLFVILLGMSELEIIEMLLIDGDAVDDLLKGKISRFTLDELIRHRAVLSGYTKEITTVLPAESLGAFLKAIDESEPAEALKKAAEKYTKESIEQGLRESEAGLTTVLNLDDLDSDD